MIQLDFNVSTFFEKPGEFDVTLLVTDQYGLMDGNISKLYSK